MTDATAPAVAVAPAPVPGTGADPAAAAAVAIESAKAHAPFRPKDASTCYNIVDSTDDKWCIATCADSCPPLTCACEGDYGPVVAISATPLPAVKPAELPKWADGSNSVAFVPKDPSSCLSVAPSTTDAWCQSTCTKSCPPQQCVCDAAAFNASAIKAAASSSIGLLLDRHAQGTPKEAPHFANGSPKPGTN